MRKKRKRFWLIISICAVWRRWYAAIFMPVCIFCFSFTRYIEFIFIWIFSCVPDLICTLIFSRCSHLNSIYGHIQNICFVLCWCFFSLLSGSITQPQPKHRCLVHTKKNSDVIRAMDEVQVMAVDVCARHHFITHICYYIGSVFALLNAFWQILRVKENTMREKEMCDWCKHNVTRWLNSDIIFECRFFFLFLILFRNFIDDLTDLFSIRSIREINILFWVHAVEPRHSSNFHSFAQTDDHTALWVTTSPFACWSVASLIFT